MTKNTIIPYWFLMLQALSHDHQEETVTWSQLMARYFGKDTDIYHLMLQVLTKAKLDHNAQVTDLTSQLANFTSTYEIKSEDKNLYLCVEGTNEKIKLLDQENASIDKALKALGYQEN